MAKRIAFFPEAAFGPALNSVGIAQAVEELGHEAVFLSDPGFVEVYEDYGFAAHPVNLSEPMPAEEMAKFWETFINGHIPNLSVCGNSPASTLLVGWRTYNPTSIKPPSTSRRSGWGAEPA